MHQLLKTLTFLLLILNISKTIYTHNYNNLDNDPDIRRNCSEIIASKGIFVIDNY